MKWIIAAVSLFCGFVVALVNYQIDPSITPVIRGPLLAGLLTGITWRWDNYFKPVSSTVLGGVSGLAGWALFVLLLKIFS
jgi:hypothetical protein